MLSSKISINAFFSEVSSVIENTFVTMQHISFKESVEISTLFIHLFAEKHSTKNWTKTFWVHLVYKIKVTLMQTEEFLDNKIPAPHNLIWLSIENIPVILQHIQEKLRLLLLSLIISPYHCQSWEGNIILKYTI